MAPLSRELLEILACPKCKSAVAEEREGLRCTRPDCALLYPVRDGIPIMLIEEARPPAGRT